MTQADKNPKIIKEMFDSLSKEYDRNNNIISLGLHKKIKKSAVNLLNIKNNTKILDLCCGTGDISEILIQKSNTTEVIGVDFSSKMIELAQKKFPNLYFTLGDATNLEFQNSQFDIITITFGLRNIENRTKAIQECYRILKNNGQLLHLDFGYQNIFSKIFEFIVYFGIKIFYKNITPYKYLIQTKKEFPNPKELSKEFKQQGFRLVKIKNYLFGIISAQIYTKY